MGVDLYRVQDAKRTKGCLKMYMKKEEGCWLQYKLVVSE